MPVVLLTTIMQLNLMLCKLMKCDWWWVCYVN
jgi:hypothetical protein